jgi:hypothetical protein
MSLIVQAFLIRVKSKYSGATAVEKESWVKVS